MKMPTFLLATLTLVLAVVAGRAQPPQVQPSAQEGLDRMGVVGYADHLSAQPGDTIAFMVSSAAPRLGRRSASSRIGVATISATARNTA